MKEFIPLRRRSGERNNIAGGERRGASRISVSQARSGVAEIRPSLFRILQRVPSRRRSGGD